LCCHLFPNLLAIFKPDNVKTTNTKTDNAKTTNTKTAHIKTIDTTFSGSAQPATAGIDFVNNKG